MQQSNQFFETAKPTRLFFTVAIPGLISMLAMSIYSVLEGIFIGQYLGESAFAAVNLAMPFVMINFSLADLIGVGSSVPISIALGRKDEKRANNYFTSSIIMIFLAGVLMGFLMYFGSPAMIKLMGAEGELARLAVRYVRVYALMSPVTTIVFAMDNYLRISGFVKTSMFLNVFMSCFTATLIFVFLGIGGMNVEGSSLATCISMSTCALAAFVPFLMKKTVLKFVSPRMSFKMIKEIVFCGAPVFLNNVAGRVASIVMNTVLLSMGGATAVAAFSVLMYAGSIVEPMLYGMSDSVQPAVGYNWGAKMLNRVRDITKCSFFACGVVSVVGAAAMLVFSRRVVGLFVKAQDVELFEMSVHAMKFFCISYVFRWLGFAVQGFYSAIEKPLPASILSLCSAMVFPVLFVFVLYPMGLDGLWLNMAATSLAVMIMAVIMLRCSQKRIAKDIENQ